MSWLFHVDQDFYIAIQDDSMPLMILDVAGHMLFYIFLRIL